MNADHVLGSSILCYQNEKLVRMWSPCISFSDPSLSKYTLLNYVYLFCYCKREIELASVWLLYYSHQSRLLLDLFVYPSTVLLYLNYIIFSSGFHDKVLIYDCRPLIMHMQSCNGKHLLLQGYSYLFFCDGSSASRTLQRRSPAKYTAELAVSAVY